ncbi:aureocin A53 family class IId bacteriocin [Staphylococcus caprae]|uniref:aureocin A53 family class IId bacteriocin n=1 Tax=Staphylococcus TaxID=1279 RepID=UPI00159F6B18|nr:aureocin A53 family class IId bacteriocin [Staphylococcus sp. HMSC62A08]
MSIVWNIIRSFAGKAYRWAASHVKKIAKWVSQGATYEQIKDWVYHAVGWR